MAEVDVLIWRYTHSHLQQHIKLTNQGKLAAQISIVVEDQQTNASGGL